MVRKTLGLTFDVALDQLLRAKHSQAPCRCSSQRAHRRILIVIVLAACKD